MNTLAVDTMDKAEFDKVSEAADVVLRETTLRPKLALVLGSGLGAFAGGLDKSVAIPYGRIPHFPVSTAVGHAGRLVVGRSGMTPVAVMQGRVHYYEGYSMTQVVFPVRVLHALGVRAVIFTNAAGGIRKTLRTRGLLLIRDHLNLMGTNPLAGPNDERFGPRFPDMSEAYSKKLLALTKKVARKLRIRLPEGVYAAVHGPSYETPAEIRALARLGADVVGMSTIPEVIAANHLGMDVLGISVVTNMAAGLSKKKINHEEVLEAGRKIERQLTGLLERLLPALEGEVA